MKKIIAHILRRPRAKVEITCPHGEFIPGAFTPGSTPRRYSCKHCGFLLTLSTFYGEVDW